MKAKVALSADDLANAECDFIGLLQESCPRSWRTCHTAQISYNWDDYQSLYGFCLGCYHPLGLICGNTPDNDLTMPNSLLASNLCRLTHNNTAGLPDQVRLLESFLQNLQPPPTLSSSTCPALAEVMKKPNP
jgi:hypothetical protein